MSKIKTSEIYYGWKIVAAILVLLSFASGLSFYNQAVYLDALATNPAFTVRSVSLAVSIFFLSSGIAGLWVAKWVQEFDPRLSIIFGAVISCGALSSLALVKEVWQLYLVYAVFGAGFSASSLIPATTLVTRWFQKNRAIALSIASTGLSLGGVIITPISVVIVEAQGLSRAAPIFGILYLIGVIPVAWIWLRPSPESMGLKIYGSHDAVPLDTSLINQSKTETPIPAAVGDALHTDGTSLGNARRNRFFWGVSIAFVFLMLAQVGGIAHQYGLAREILTDAQTAVIVAILPIASIIGRLIGGWLVEQISIRVFSIVVMVLQVIALSLLAGSFSAASLGIGLALFGLTVGNLLMLQPLLIAEAFGAKDYARIFSICNLMSSLGTAAGPALLGLIYTASQNQYSMSYAVAALAGLIGLFSFLSGGAIKQR
jgi:MFS family permease